MRLPSSEQVTIFLPDGEKDPAVQGPVCPENICIGVPEGTFHIQTVPSSMPPKITGPEGCQFSHYHQFILAGKSYKNFITRLKRNNQFPFPTFQIRTCPSIPPVARYPPSCEKATFVTLSVCPSNFVTISPFVTSQTYPKSSPPPVTAQFSCNATLYTGLVCKKNPCIESSTMTSSSSISSASSSSDDMGWSAWSWSSVYSSIASFGSRNASSSFVSAFSSLL